MSSGNACRAQLCQRFARKGRNDCRGLASPEYKVGTAFRTIMVTDTEFLVPRLYCSYDQLSRTELILPS